MKKTYAIDLEGKSSPLALQRLFAAAVPVPRDYGRNLDAMYDVLTEYGGGWRLEFKNSANAPEAVFRTFSVYGRNRNGPNRLLPKNTTPTEQLYRYRR